MKALYGAKLIEMNLDLATLKKYGFDTASSCYAKPHPCCQFAVCECQQNHKRVETTLSGLSPEPALKKAALTGYVEAHEVTVFVCAMKTEQQLPIYRYDDTFDRYMIVQEALCHVDESETQLTSKGRDRQFRYTSGRWNPRPNLQWRVLPSADYSVLQLADS